MNCRHIVRNIPLLLMGLCMGVFLTLNLRSVNHLDSYRSYADIRQRQSTAAVSSHEITEMEQSNQGVSDKSKNEYCNEKRKDIAFLKVHKCGSTTTSNILQRFGLRNKLNFVLPDKPSEGHFWVLGNVTDLKWKSIIPIPDGQVYNILAVDTFFDAAAYRKMIPNNPFIMAIVRDPVDRFVSQEFYEGRGRKLYAQHGTNPYIFSHIQNTSLQETSSIRGMMYDFGLPVEERHNDDKIKLHLKHVDKEFDFVMLLEYFDESLILLKRRLCWDTKDLIYITGNRNTWDKKEYALSPRDRQVLYTIQKADVVLYNHYRRTLFDEIIILGNGFLEEVHDFKSILQLVVDFCNNMEIATSRTELIIASGKWYTEFKLDFRECEVMLMREFPVVKVLQDRQRQIYKDSL